MNQHQQSSTHHQHQKHNQHGHDGGNYFMQKMPNKQHHENQTLSIDPSKLRFSNSSATDDSIAKLGNSSHYQWRNVGNRPVSSTQVNASNAPPPTSLLKRPGQNYKFLPYQQPSAVAGTANAPAGGNKSNVEVNDAFDGKQCQGLITKLVEEALNTREWQPEVLSIWRSHSGSQQSKTLFHLLTDYLHKSTVKRQHRQACGNIFAYLMDKDAVEKEIFEEAYSRFGDDFPDLLVDVPNGWGYVFEFLGPIIHSGHLDLKDVWQRRWLDDFSLPSVLCTPLLATLFRNSEPPMHASCGTTITSLIEASFSGATCASIGSLYSRTVFTFWTTDPDKIKDMPKLRRPQLHVRRWNM